MSCSLLLLCQLAFFVLFPLLQFLFLFFSANQNVFRLFLRPRPLQRGRRGAAATADARQDGNRQPGGHRPRRQEADPARHLRRGREARPGQQQRLALAREKDAFLSDNREDVLLHAFAMPSSYLLPLCCPTRGAPGLVMVIKNISPTVALQWWTACRRGQALLLIGCARAFRHQQPPPCSPGVCMRTSKQSVSCP